jgi:hypothetical protein
MVNVPANVGQEWETIISQTRQNVIAKLSRLLKMDIAALIEVVPRIQLRKSKT